MKLCPPRNSAGDRYRIPTFSRARDPDCRSRGSRARSARGAESRPERPLERGAGPGHWIQKGDLVRRDGAELAVIVDADAGGDRRQAPEIEYSVREKTGVPNPVVEARRSERGVAAVGRALLLPFGAGDEPHAFGEAQVVLPGDVLDAGVDLREAVPVNGPVSSSSIGSSHVISRDRKDVRTEWLHRSETRRSGDEKMTAVPGPRSDQGPTHGPHRSPPRGNRRVRYVRRRGLRLETEPEKTVVL